MQHKRLSKNFESWEFDSKDLEFSGLNMDAKFIEKLQLMRDYANVRFDIKSGYRTKAHNKKVGGKADSEHLTGNAADIKCNNSLMRSVLIRSAILAGFSRIGIGKSFVHVDNSFTKSPFVVWLY